MGDRANVKIVEIDGGTIYLYTHWGGSELPQDLQAALIRGRERWKDESYLTRIILCTMVPDNQKDEIISFGISTYLCDNNHDILEVNIKEQKVKRTTEEGIVVSEWSFDEYCSLDVSEWDY